jgi:hypothetical protein
VPAGTYEKALRVRYTGALQIDSNSEMPQTFFPLAGSAIVWYVAGLGPVRGVASSSVTSDVEIVLSAVQP